MPAPIVAAAAALLRQAITALIRLLIRKAVTKLVSNTLIKLTSLNKRGIIQENEIAWTGDFTSVDIEESFEDEDQDNLISSDSFDEDEEETENYLDGEADNVETDADFEDALDNLEAAANLYDQADEIHEYEFPDHAEDIHEHEDSQPEQPQPQVLRTTFSFSNEDDDEY